MRVRARVASGWPLFAARGNPNHRRRYATHEVDAAPGGRAYARASDAYGAAGARYAPKPGGDPRARFVDTGGPARKAHEWNAQFKPVNPAGLKEAP